MIYYRLIIIFVMLGSFAWADSCQFHCGETTSGSATSGKTKHKSMFVGVDNNASLGFQIGGVTLLGLDYEVRTSEYLGIHGGVGAVGAAFGTRMHFGTEMMSPFIDVSFKDAGFGLFEAFAVELGGTVSLTGH